MELAISLEQWTWLSVSKLQACLWASCKHVCEHPADCPWPSCKHVCKHPLLKHSTKLCKKRWQKPLLVVIVNYMIDSSDPQWFFRTICSVPYCWSFFVFSIHRPPQWVIFSKNLYLGFPHSLSLCNDCKWDSNQSVLGVLQFGLAVSVSFSPACALEIHLQKKTESFNQMCIGIQTKSLHENGCQGYWLTTNCMLCWQVEPATKSLNPKRCFEIDIAYLQPNL